MAIGVGIGLTVQVKGVQSFMRGLQAAPEVLQQENRMAMIRGTIRVLNNARRRVHRRSGDLYRSGNRDVSPDGSQGIVYFDKVYAAAEEFGFPIGYPIHYSRGRRLASGTVTRPYIAYSHGRDPHPFLHPAAEEEEPNVLQEFEKAAANLLTHLANTTD